MKGLARLAVLLAIVALLLMLAACFEIGTVSVDSTGSGATDIDLLKMLGTISGSGIFRLNRTFTIPNGTQVSAVEFMTAIVSGCPQVRCE